MDLPTYTSIWRIEKRLYKLYDFRLPMPLPIGQLTVFTAISVPYVVLLTVLGLPFSHSLIWLYILPPGVLTWLATRPVLESKRLPELIGSQLRYLFEPGVWCRLAPESERDVIRVSARVRRRRRSRPAPAIEPQRVRRSQAPATRGRATRVRVTSNAAADAGSVLTRGRAAAVKGVAPGAGSGAGLAAGPGSGRARRGKPARLRVQPLPARAAIAPRVAVAFGDDRPARPATAPLRTGTPASVPLRTGTPEAPASRPGAPASRPGAAAVPPGAGAPEAVPARSAGRTGPAVADGSRGPAATASATGTDRPAERRPMVTVVREGAVTLPSVESAIAGPAAHRSGGPDQRVVVIPGGHRPGKPDRLQRDRARARLPISGPRTVVLLGCTVGAGQTTTALLLGEVLASVRDDAVAVVDLNPNAGSAARRALARPALGQAASLGRSRLRVLGADQDAAGATGMADGTEAMPRPARPSGDELRQLDAACEDSVIVLADPATPAVPRLVAVADRLVLVAPATAAAAGAITMTFEWLEAHGQSALAAAAILVINGVSRRTMPHVETAERVAAGRCRAIVRVPWDDQLSNPQAKKAVPAISGSAATHHWTGVLSPGAVAAYTALAGVLVASLSDPDSEPAPAPALAGPDEAARAGG